MHLRRHHPLFRLVALVLMFTFVISVPLAGSATGQGQNPATARVHARLNSAERATAIAKALEMDKAAKAVAAKVTEQRLGLPRGVAARNDKSETATVQPASTSVSSATSTPSVYSAASVPSETSAPVIARKAEDQTRQSTSLATTRPKSTSEVLFNAATSVMGMPGLTSTRNDPYNPNADQGLGFHADGTVRIAGGEDSASGYNGKRAAAYAGSGLGYGPNGTTGSMGYQEPGYDPATGQNYRYSDPTSGGRRTTGQGGYGSMDGMDPTRLMMDRSLNYGMGLANTAAEGMFMGLYQSPYGGAKARLNFMVDWDGKVNGEGDLLLPLYDSQYTTVYTQLGTRSMNAEDSKDRWIGNFGVGQRWYPQAVNKGIAEDAGNWMLGYNAFYDYDFTRSHARGGVGIEGQYDWIHLASNYYAPLSSWKDSYDYDGDFVQERAAEGWDVRAKGYMPFYRNIALTGALTQWYGDNVGMFGAKSLEKDPKVWSYGLEYTPIPLVSGFVNQRTTERGKSDTEFGLRFTYNFSMPWDEQTSHSKVAAMRTVGGSRHEFVDRENRMILEYKAKDNYHVDYLGKVGTNQFKFRIRNGFDKYVAGQTVRVSAGGGVTLAEAAAPAPTTFMAQAGEYLGSLFSVGTAHAADFSQTYITNGNGEFVVRLDNVTTTPVVLTMQAGNTSQSVTITDVTVIAGSPVTTLGNLTQGTYYHTASAAVTSDKAGTGFYILRESIQTPPSVSDVFASATTVSLINGSSTINFTDLKYSTAYTLYVVATDGTTPQTVVSSTSLTTGNLPTGYVDYGNLIWRPIDNNALTWNDANTACTTQTINGQTGWRLPSKQELLDLFNSGTMIGQGWALGSAWSSDAGGPGKHWSFSLSGGFGGAYSDTVFRVVSCVR